MKQIRMLAIISLTLSLPIFLAGPVTADALSSIQQIQVTARVLPMRRIIIDQTGQIVQITSNTSDNVTPQVYIQNDTSNLRQPLSDNLLKAYKKLVPADAAKPGIMYQRDVYNLLHK